MKYELQWLADEIETLNKHIHRQLMLGVTGMGIFSITTPYQKLEESSTSDIYIT